MEAISISNMTPRNILVKEAFKRTRPSAQLGQITQSFRSGGVSSVYDDTYDPLQFDILSQADFLREFDVNSHRINDIKYLPNIFVKDSKGKISAKQKSRIAIAWQERIWTKRLATLTGNNINLRITNSRKGDGEEAKLNEFREGWESKNIENAIYEAIAADGKTGDAAVCFFLSGNKVGWRIFTYEKGDVLYPHYDPYTGKLAVFGRKYSQTDYNNQEIVEYLDVWDNKYYCRYKKDKAGLKGVANKVKDVFGFDGWVIDQEPTPHGFNRIPIAYDRYGEPFWAKSQSNIESYEIAISQFAENNAIYALRILYALGGEVDMSATIDGTPWRIDSPDPNTKIGFLEPSDASRSFELQLSILEKNIMKASFASETPELKSGSDLSSLTVRTLLMDSYQKALLDAQHLQPFLDDVVELFKYGYSLEIGKPSDYETFNVKGEIFPYVFMSETEQVSNIVQLRAAGALSKQTASEMAYELGYGVVSESERLAKEAREELVGVDVPNYGTSKRNPVNESRKKSDE